MPSKRFSSVLRYVYFSVNSYRMIWNIDGLLSTVTEDVRRLSSGSQMRERLTSTPLFNVVLRLAGRKWRKLGCVSRHSVRSERRLYLKFRPVYQSIYEKIV